MTPVKSSRICSYCGKTKGEMMLDKDPYCQPCELALGRVEMPRMHNVFADRPRRNHLGFEEIQGPWQENAVRVLEEDR